MLECRHPISTNARKALINPRILIDPGDNEPDPFCSPSLYCLSWETYHYRGHRMIIHEGLIDGFGSSHFFLPDDGFGSVILGNSDGAEQVTWILARELIDAALEIPQADRPDWAALQAQKLARGGDDDTDRTQELRESLSSGQGTDMPVPPLEGFVGRYSNPGYGALKVEIKDGDLFIDATDRGFPCTLTFEHVRTWHDMTTSKKSSLMRLDMIAHLTPVRGSPDEYLASQFVFDTLVGASEGSKAARMTILLEETLPDGEMIWFDRV